MSKETTFKLKGPAKTHEYELEFCNAFRTTGTEEYDSETAEEHKDKVYVTMSNDHEALGVYMTREGLLEAAGMFERAADELFPEKKAGRKKKAK